MGEYAKTSSIEDIIRPIKKAPQIRSDHDIFLIQEVTKDIPFFQKYILEGKEDVHQKSCKHMTYERFNSGDMVFSQGDRGSKFYIILEGLVGIYIKIKNEQKKVKELSRGESFGELALINDAPRSASIKCIVDCHFAVLDKKNYITLFQQILDNEIKKEISFYPEIELFSNWNYNKMKSFYNHSFRIKVKKGDTIISESDNIDAIYIIASGEFVVKKKINNDTEKFQQTEDLHQLKRQNYLSPSMANKRLFIMSKYEIFGQENAEDEEPKFYYTVECHSFEGNLIYIKSQDYMKIIMKDESQKEYMQSYSQRRIQRVQNRMKEISQALNLQQSDEATVPFKRNKSQQRTLIVIPSENVEGEVNGLLDIDVKRSVKKRLTCIDALGDQNRISKENNNALAFLSTDAEDSTPGSNLLNNFKSNNNNNGSLSVQINQNMRRSASEIGKEIISSRFQKINIEGANSQTFLKCKTKNLDSQSICFSPQTHNDTPNHKLDDESYLKVNTPQSVSSANQSFSPQVKKSHSIVHIKKNGNLSNFGEIFSPVKTTGTKVIVSQINTLNSINMIDDDETQNITSTKDIKESSNNIQKTNLNQLKSQQTNNFKQQMRSSSQVLISSRNQNHGESMIDDDDQCFNQQNLIKKTLNNIVINSQKQINHDETIQKNFKKQASCIELQDQDYDQLHPLVKGFHEQLKVRFYNKFKNGSIEDLKSHMSYAPIQTLQPDKLNPEIIKNGVRPAIFLNKKSKEIKSKEIREYEQKLKQLIKSDCQIELESISPLKTKDDKLQRLKIENNSPLSAKEAKKSIAKKSLINIFQTTIQNNNSNSNQTQVVGGQFLKNLLKSENYSPEKIINYGHTRIASFDVGMNNYQKPFYSPFASTQNTNHAEKSINQIHLLPNIEKPKTLKNSSFLVKTFDIHNNSQGNSSSKQQHNEGIQNQIQTLKNPKQNHNFSQIQINNTHRQSQASPKQINSLSSLDLKNYTFFMSNKVGFKGQKGFNCSQFNLRKDKSSYYNS
ncbi:cyclic nucleotide-binding domain protein (macronuclear) [Tetrahymena thermophila SB210]|uniref:Cyclic nucleotide-binding domain protein n=1 Tax=Tetrahymena thermophila (strain SB210) TaxID=312017 RepID=Q23WN2_TETTS|nr:cyclic nucleotide-binding domain protein [Tetrahymena thermophila SB210]EAS00948.1 cyclic nucleotide-binding domain protein [Tetrahymena thermophila SB210]|eukprot:XP_001021193.1 cyclic nucleotide-binding domain protein [Tetrahymena thermophila SB210]